MSEIIDLDVALTFLRTWRDDRALIRCEVRLRGCLAVIVARVEAVRDTEVRLRADALDVAALVVPVSPASTFLYRDMRDSPELQDKYDSTLTLVYSYEEPDDGAFESVVFAELRGTT